jgi:hypothetical protein
MRFLVISGGGEKSVIRPESGLVRIAAARLNIPAVEGVPGVWL